MCVSSRRSDFEHGTFVDGQHGHVKGPSSQIEDQDVLLSLEVFVEPVGQGSCGGLVDDPEHIEAGDSSSVFRRLPLGIVEVSRHGDHSVSDLVTKEGLCSFLHLGQHHCADLLRVEPLPLSFELHANLGLASVVLHLEGPVLEITLDLGIVELSSNKPLGIEHCVLRVQRSLGLGCVPDEPLGVGEGHVTWRRTVALVVGDDLDTAVLEHTDAGVRCTQVDADGRRSAVRSGWHGCVVCLV
ncbi:hypothetical protein ISCGN_030196 [Ixodes scapularis]